MWAVVLGATALLAPAAARGPTVAFHAGEAGHASARRATKLRLCNAYAEEVPLEVEARFEGRHKKLTKQPLKYGACADVETALASGNTISFKKVMTAMGKLGNIWRHHRDHVVGSFVARAVPRHAALLLLVIYRDGGHARFESNVFKHTEEAQLSVLDAYSGPAKSLIMLRPLMKASSKPAWPLLAKMGLAHTPKPRVVAVANTTEPVALSYKSVVGLKPGAYELELEGEGVGKGEAIEVKPGEVFVVIRTGHEGKIEPHIKQSLMVYPGGAGAAAEGSRAAARHATVLAAPFLVACGAWLRQ